MLIRKILAADIGKLFFRMELFKNSNTILKLAQTVNDSYRLDKEKNIFPFNLRKVNNKDAS